MQDGPTPREILDAVARFLRDDLLPQLKGAVAFQVRVAANAIDLVAREIDLSPDRIEAEHAGLRGLLGHDGDIADLTGELAARIADRSIDLNTPGLEAFLWSATEAKLAIDQPQYAGLRRANALRAAAGKES